MKDVDVPEGGVESLVNNLQGLVVTRRNEGPTGFPLMKKFLFRDLARLGVVSDEYDLDVLIFGAKELVEEKKETPRQVLFHGVHGARGVHDAKDHCIGLAPNVAHGMSLREIVLVKREASRLKGDDFFSLGGLPALDPGAGCAPLVEADPDPFFPVALTFVLLLDFDFPQVFPLQIGQLEILEHDLDEFFQGDIGLIIIPPGLIPGAAVLPSLFAFADDLTGLCLLAAALPDTGHVLPVDKAVLFHSTDGDFDDAVTVLADDRLLGDDVRDILPDSFVDLLAVAQAISRAAVAPLGGGKVVGTENRFHNLRMANGE